jgi:hypothetical protein
MGATIQQTPESGERRVALSRRAQELLAKLRASGSRRFALTISYGAAGKVETVLLPLQGGSIINPPDSDDRDIVNELRDAGYITKTLHVMDRWEFSLL